MKSPLIAALIILAVFTGCAAPDAATTRPLAKTESMGGARGNARFLGTMASADATYGYTEENPIKVGVPDLGPAMERRFLDQLAGPKGEPIRYQRIGSCCHFSTPNGFLGVGLLDKYEVWIGDRDVPVILFLNMYDFEEPRIPVGFKSIHQD